MDMISNNVGDTSIYSRGQGTAHRCQLNVKPASLQGFALTPSPSPTGRREQEIYLVPLLLREKGLGDEGARYLYNAHPISLLA
ncbi:hypothetical protein FDUTEX481_00243 [Tolypothrix sp. PCC 7601]|nr:hypothetical protein FDUTEX481_00243 [Tolypothrix sp. PCC 7601]